MSSFKSVDRKEIRKKGFPASISLSDALMKFLSDKRRKIIFALRDLGEEEKKIAEAINSKRPTPSGVLGLSDGSITLCEDEDDFMVLTMEERQQLKDIREQIASKLNEALNCGMGSLGVIQRQCVNYGVKP